MRRIVPLPFLLVIVLVLPLPGSPEPRFTASLQTSYTGAHQDLYTQQQDRVRLLIQQAQLEISSQLGLLQYQEGFRCPLTVRFDDAAAPGVEHALAYVRLIPTVRGAAQELVINLDVMANHPEDFDKIFYHEMTHAVLNDAVVVEYQRRLPSWVQEGLAVYIAGDGEEWVSHAAKRYRKSQVHALVRDLEEPVLDYPRNYLAFKYLYEKHGINSLQAFVRDLTQGKLPHDAIEDSTGVSWEEFCQKLKEYSLTAYQDQARPDF
jgi:hypothetical protein